MKYVIVVVVFVLLVFSYYWGEQRRGTDNSSVRNVSSGIIHYGNETFANLQGNGFVTLDGTSVRKSLVVNGSLDANKAHIGSLKVNGHATLAGTTIAGKTEITGFLSAEKCLFKKEVSVAAHKVRFVDCTLDAISVKNASWSFGIQIIELGQKTICKGPIIFESGKGKIILSEGSQVLGSIQGAVVEKQ